MSTAIRVHIPASLRKLTDGISDVEVDAATVREVVIELDRRFPRIGDRLIEDDRLKQGVAVAVNSRLCATGLATPVPPGAEVQFVPALAGG
ncbi:ThiS family protein [Caulifigura coniformis]|uniref:ThiS family protein n=1 Tax=Caulifigura coniformis TaxID=2527983 RepID=A0A517SJN3_9PLAN|nr:MoaD/ThiS family protein [Caulifigura coniformis]QDT56333.1 ThiS family protein [Caulifigura coniformis]